jgi:hypothetical protein
MAEIKFRMVMEKSLVRRNLAESRFQVMTDRSAVASHPQIGIDFPVNCKILGGGAIIDAVQPANFLTASFPTSFHSWFAAGKDHKVSSPASITIWAFAVFDPGGLFDHHIAHATSPTMSQPQIIATLPPGYHLTGGGAFVDYHGGAQPSAQRLVCPVVRSFCSLASHN